MTRDLDDVARAAIEKHQRLLYLKTLELCLGEMVRTMGIREVRKLLLEYARHLKWF